MDSRQRNFDEVLGSFSDLKQKTLLLSKSFDRLGFNHKADRCFQCGSRLEFHKAMSDLADEEVDYKLCEANFCRERLCPMCAKRRSLKIFGQVTQIVEHIDTSKYDFVLLTLTVPNVSGDELSNKISQMQKAFNKLIHYKRFKGAVVGYFRALEVTYNHNKKSKSYDTYHPHYHIILVVQKDYFTSFAYIKRKEWLSMWQTAMNDFSITQVDVRKVRSKLDKKIRGVVSIAGAVAEVAKYTLKPSDYIFNNPALMDKVVSVLSSALRGRRLVAFGGLFADIRELLGLDDVENGDLVHTDNQEIVSGDSLFLVRRWNWLFSKNRYDMYEEVVETSAELEERRQKRLEALKQFYAECRRKKAAA